MWRMHGYEGLRHNRKRIMLATLFTLAAAIRADTSLVEHEYGTNHIQMDDGYPYEEQVQVPLDDPS
jgi:hypothetical protein